MEIFSFTYEGHPSNYSLEELEDGYWAIKCDHALFRQVFGSDSIKQSDSLSDVLVKIGETNPVLMNAMWQPFQKSCEAAFAKYRSIKTSSNLFG